MHGAKKSKKNKQTSKKKETASCASQPDIKNSPTIGCSQNIVSARSIYRIHNSDLNILTRQLATMIGLNAACQGNVASGE